MYAYKWWIVCGGRLRFAEAASRIWKYFNSFKSPTLNDASHLTLQQSFSFFTTTTAVNHLLKTFTVNPLPAILTYYIGRIHRFWLGFGSVDRWAPFRTPGNLHWCSSSIDTKFFSAPGTLGTKYESECCREHGKSRWAWSLYLHIGICALHAPAPCQTFQCYTHFIVPILPASARWHTTARYRRSFWTCDLGPCPIVALGTQLCRYC